MQIPSGFEVKRVVFMCVRAFVFVSVRTCTPAEIHLGICLSVYIHAYIYINAYIGLRCSFILPRLSFCLLIQKLRLV